MSELKKIFPNLFDLLCELSSNYNGGLKSDDGYRMSFIMPVFTFGKHVGDNYFEIEKKINGYVFSYVSKKGAVEKARTSSFELFKDLSFKDWDEIIDNVLRRHIIKPEYIEFATG